MKTPVQTWQGNTGLLHRDRLFPGDPSARSIARALYDRIATLPILSPHGHTDPRWLAANQPFDDPASLLIVPDHYIVRMLYSQGAPLEGLGIGEGKLRDPRRVWRIFAENYSLFRGTPTRLWLDYAFQELFSLNERLCPANADRYFDVISEHLATDAFRPRALYERFNIEALATTDSAIDTLEAHQAIRESGWPGRVLPTFRPDSVVDPDARGFFEDVATLGEMHSEDTGQFAGYLRALRAARQRFIELGCKATDHGHPTARTADLDLASASALFDRIRTSAASDGDSELFRAQMLTEMARMSLDDGLVMQLHPGSFRDHNQLLHQRFGRDMGADIPTSMDYVHGLKPLLDRFGNEPTFTLIVFTLDESTYSRELAPLAGHYPCLRLGPPWWFHDSPEGMMRFREQATETAGFYNTVGFNDDTRAFLSMPGRHDVARRVDSAFLARLVVEGRIDEDEAHEIAYDLTNGLVRKAYKL